MSSPVFSGLVGQEQAISALDQAIQASNNDANQAMTHAWLFTGPPGSGRSNIAKAFAAALICREKGCGECSDCVTALAGTHPDLELVNVNRLSIKIDEIREIVTRSSWGAATSRWRVVVIEDCDRMTEAAATALLKALEEPGASTIWLLCAPTLHDVLPTIRSRCRNLNLKTPTKVEITRYLTESFQISEDKAELAANISQGHIGKAKGFLKSDITRETRKKTFDLLLSIRSEGDAIRAADEILKLAQVQVEERFYSLIGIEAEEMKAVMQSGTRGMISGGAKALKELEKDQKARTTRAIKDQLDGILLDYMTFFRDCLAVNGPRVNSDLTEQIQKKSKTLGEGPITELVSKISDTRELLTTNASQILLIESLFTYYVRANRGN